MNKWHMKIADCTEAQKKRLKRVYGNLPININTYLGLHNGIVIGTFGPDSMGELITPDEAFERLGLDVNYTANKLIEANEALCEKIKELEQENIELNQQGELCAHELGHAEQKINELEGKCENLEHALNKRGTDLSQTRQANRDLCKRIKKLEQQLAAKPLSIDWTLVDSDFTHLVQDKETGSIKLLCAGYYSDCKEHYEILATRPKPKYTKEQIEAVKDFDAWVSRRHEISGEFNWWLKEVSIND